MTSFSLQRSQILSEKIPISQSPHGTSGCAANDPKEYSVCTSIIAVVYRFFKGIILSCFRCLAIKSLWKGKITTFSKVLLLQARFEKYHGFQLEYLKTTRFMFIKWDRVHLYSIRSILVFLDRGVANRGYFDCFLAFWLVIFLSLPLTCLVYIFCKFI